MYKGENEENSKQNDKENRDEGNRHFEEQPQENDIHI